MSRLQITSKPAHEKLCRKSVAFNYAFGSPQCMCDWPSLDSHTGSRPSVPCRCGGATTVLLMATSSGLLGAAVVGDISPQWAESEPFCVTHGADLKSVRSLVTNPLSLPACKPCMPVILCMPINIATKLFSTPRTPALVQSKTLRPKISALCSVRWEKVKSRRHCCCWTSSTCRSSIDCSTESLMRPGRHWFSCPIL